MIDRSYCNGTWRGGKCPSEAVIHFDTKEGFCRMHAALQMDARRFKATGLRVQVPEGPFAPSPADPRPLKTPLPPDPPKVKTKEYMPTMPPAMHPAFLVPPKIHWDAPLYTGMLHPGHSAIPHGLQNQPSESVTYTPAGGLWDGLMAAQAELAKLQAMQAEMAKYKEEQDRLAAIERLRSAFPLNPLGLQCVCGSMRQTSTFWGDNKGVYRCTGNSNIHGLDYCIKWNKVYHQRSEL